MDNGHEDVNGQEDDDDDECDYDDDCDNKDYYWDDKLDGWVYYPRKRKRRKDFTNNKEKKWRLGMQRNWGTKKYAKMMASLTIKREKLDMVGLVH